MLKWGLTVFVILAIPSGDAFSFIVDLQSYPSQMYVRMASNKLLLPSSFPLADKNPFPASPFSMSSVSGSFVRTAKQPGLEGAPTRPGTSPSSSRSLFQPSFSSCREFQVLKYSSQQHGAHFVCHSRWVPPKTGIYGGDVSFLCVAVSCSPLCSHVLILHLKQLRHLLHRGTRYHWCLLPVLGNLVPSSPQVEEVSVSRFSLNPSVHLLTLSYSFTWREEITIGPNGEVSKNFVRVYHGSAASSADHLDFDGSSSEGEDKGSSTKDVELDYSPDRSAVVLDSIETENRLHAGGDAAAARRR